MKTSKTRVNKKSKCKWNQEVERKAVQKICVFKVDIDVLWHITSGRTFQSLGPATLKALTHGAIRDEGTAKRQASEHFSRDDSEIAGDRYRRCSIFFRMLGMEMRIAFVLS